MHVKSNLSLMMVSLAVAVNVRMALFWVCQLSMSPLALKGPRSLSVPGRSGHFRQIAALQGEAEHVTSFQRISGGNEQTWMASAS